MSNEIFVFGSNLAGVHGAGAARVAHKYFGAVRGQGIGHHGNSYAIPTKDARIQTLPLVDIVPHVNNFLWYAYLNPDLFFKVTRLGCGLAGYTDEAIAPLFKGASANCLFDSAWQPWLGDKAKYWGTV